VQLGAQSPLEQAVEPFALVQPLPQPPQLLTSVLKFDSQPSAGSRLQLPKPAAQPENIQVPVEQSSPVAFAGAHDT
jgi:hypothetical protein